MSYLALGTAMLRGMILDRIERGFFLIYVCNLFRLQAYARD